MATKKRKTTTAIVAGVTAAALLLGGTFAWQSINQTALNESSDVINPGGRLHDDFDGSNKDVYVENFAEEDIFARIQLSEYFEIVLNHGTAGAKTETIIGSKNDDGTYNYVPYLFDDNANGDGTFNAGIGTDEGPYWSWTTGGSTTFMPTFNKNKDSLAADINGNYVDAIGGISNRDGEQYENYVEYTDGEEKTANAIYDIDPNMADELAEAGVDIAALIDGTATADDYATYVKLVEETHIAKSTGNGSLMSMADWLAMVEADGGYDEATHGEYWVYDTDGWVYWSAPIAPGEATGLLLDEIALTDVMDDTWYYAINVVAQFVTAGDTGSVEDSTGFYDTDNGTVPSADALDLLDKIGINDTTPGVDEDETEPSDPDEYQTLTLTSAGDGYVELSYGEPVIIAGEDDADLSSITMTDADGAEVIDFTYDPTTGVLEFYGFNSPYTVTDASGNYTGTIEVYTSMDQIQLYTSLRDPESPDYGVASFIKPGVTYPVYVQIDVAELADAPEGFDVTSATPVLTFTGTPIEGEEFTLDESHYTLGDWTAFTYYNDEEYGEEYYLATTTLTVNKSVDYGTTVAMESTIDGYENDFASWDDYVVSDIEIDSDDVTIALYDPDGNEVTINTVQKNTTYDIVVSMDYNGDTLVIYSTKSDVTVSDRVYESIDLRLYTHYPDVLGDVYNFVINENGQLVVTEDSDPNVYWEEYGRDEFRDDLCISFLISDLVIDVTDDDPETGTHCYVYDERDMWFAGEEPFDIDIELDAEDYENEVYGILNDGPKKLIIWDGLDSDNRSDITGLVTFTITGNSDGNTKIEKAVDGYYYLTLGENETAESITISAAIDGRGQGSITVQILYATVQVNDVTLTEKNEGGAFLFTGEGEGTYTFSLKEGTEATWEYWGVAGDMNFDDTTTPGALTVTVKDADAGPAYCSMSVQINCGDDYALINIEVTINFPTTTE